jgi:Flp pilus assembly protein TadG
MTNGTVTPADPAVIAALQGIQAASEAAAEAAAASAAAAQAATANTGVRPPTTASTLPQTFNTTAQGYLSYRWQRRDGNVYPAGVLPARRNSPIAGGPDANARVAVESGAPRVGRNAEHPARHIRASVKR